MSLYEPGPLELLDEQAYYRVFHPDAPPAPASPASTIALELAAFAAAVDAQHAEILDHAEPDVDVESTADLERVAADALALENGAVPGDSDDIRGAIVELDGELDEAVALLANEKSRTTPSPWIRPIGEDDFDKHDGDEDGRYQY